MSLVKDASTYKATPISNPKREGIRIITEMSTLRILWFVANRHRVGLLATSNIALLGAIVWPKISWIF